jgi:hypothetical protein
VTATIGDTQVSLAWVAPSDTGGTAITDYTVQYSTNGTSWTTFSDGVGTDASATVTGLTNDVSYQFRVAASNTVGTGSFSFANSGSSVTPKAIQIVLTNTSTGYFSIEQSGLGTSASPFVCVVTCTSQPSSGTYKSNTATLSVRFPGYGKQMGWAASWSGSAQARFYVDGSYQYPSSGSGTYVSSNSPKGSASTGGYLSPASDYLGCALFAFNAGEQMTITAYLN